VIGWLACPIWTLLKHGSTALSSIDSLENKKICDLSLADIPSDGWPNLRAQLWAYGQIDDWKLCERHGGEHAHRYRRYLRLQAGHL